jgi:hypothetical protein
MRPWDEGTCGGKDVHGALDLAGLSRMVIADVWGVKSWSWGAAREAGRGGCGVRREEDGVMDARRKRLTWEDGGGGWSGLAEFQ